MPRATKSAGTATVGVKVSRLIRTRYGPIVLPPQLKRGQKYEMEAENVAKLMTWAGLDAPVVKRRVQNNTAARHTKARAGQQNQTSVLLIRPDEV